MNGRHLASVSAVVSNRAATVNQRQEKAVLRLTPCAHVTATGVKKMPVQQAAETMVALLPRSSLSRRQLLFEVL